MTYIRALAIAMLAMPAQAQTPAPTTPPAANPADPRLAALKAAAVAGVTARAGLAQVSNDQSFSYGELAFQEVETSKYLTALLEKQGFTVTRGVAGLPTGWTAKWTGGSGGPVIALGSDIDCMSCRPKPASGISSANRASMRLRRTSRSATVSPMPPR